MNNDSFVHSLLNEKVKLSAKYMNKNYKNHLLNILIARNEGKCSKHGYIKKNSIELKRVSVGALEIASLRGFVNYDIQFSALVCNPTKGSILKSTVLNSNNFGVLCVCGVHEDTTFVPIIDIIIPKNSLHIRSDSSVDLESLRKDDVINVEIVGKKFEINDIKISAVGKVVELNDDTPATFDVEDNEIDTSDAKIDDEAYEDDFEETLDETGTNKDDTKEDDSDADENNDETLEDEEEGSDAEGSEDVENDDDNMNDPDNETENNADDSDSDNVVSDSDKEDDEDPIN